MDSFLNSTMDSILDLRSYSEIAITIKDHSSDTIFPINILREQKDCPALVLERRIHALRQLYATVFLVKAGRAKEIPPEAEKNPDFDLEEKFLSKDERLYLSSASVGSFLATLHNWTETGRKTIEAIVALFVPEGRELLLRTLRARTVSREVQTKREEFDFNAHKLKTMIGFVKEVEEISDPVLRERVAHLIERNAQELDVQQPKQIATES